MAKEDMDLFLDALKNEKSLSEEFAKAVADTARDNGFEVDEQDVLDHFLGDDTPSTRPLPDDGRRMSTMMVGEEGGRASTGGIGEEGKGPRPPRRGITTAAVGEESKKPRL